MKDDKNSFINMIEDGSYISWLEYFLKNNGPIDTLYFTHENMLSINDRRMIGDLGYLFVELTKCRVKNDNYNNCFHTHFLKYDNEVYEIGYTGQCYYCENSPYVAENNKVECVEYNELKNSCIEDMEKENNKVFKKIYKY